MINTGIPEMISKNWPLILWCVSALSTIIGVVVFNAKIALPAFKTRLDGFEDDMDSIKEKEYVVVSECMREREACGKHQMEEFEQIQSNIEKILNCIDKTEKARVKGQTTQMMFMTAVKEKLKLNFEIPKL